MEDAHHMTRAQAPDWKFPRENWFLKFPWLHKTGIVAVNHQTIRLPCLDYASLNLRFVDIFNCLCQTLKMKPLFDFLFASRYHFNNRFLKYFRKRVLLYFVPKCYHLGFFKEIEIGFFYSQKNEEVKLNLAWHLDN